jgi:hypothetical protein
MILLQELDSNSDMDDLFAALKRWKSVVGDKPVYRGISNSAIINRSTSFEVFDSKTKLFDVYNIDTRKDRIPSDSSEFVHNKLDAWLNEKTGIKFRSESIFAIKDKKIAETYGRPYVVIPKGEFHYCWSPYVADAYATFGNREFTAKFIDYMSSEKAAPFIYSDNKRHTIKDFRKWYVSLQTKTEDEFEKIILKIAKSIPNFWSFDSGIKGCPDNHEIMIACDSYYAIPAEKYEEIIKQINTSKL